MTAEYNKTSPYYKSEQTNGYLDVMTWRTVPAENDDLLFTVTKSYEHRPDLLAYDLYKDVGLWWVFSERNPAVLKDPVFDLEAGVKIYLPKLSSMKRVLGL
jgi:hypothetical protein